MGQIKADAEKEIFSIHVFEKVSQQLNHFNNDIKNNQAHNN